MSISNFEYEQYEYKIKISMNAYKYQKLCVRLESAHHFVAFTTKKKQEKGNTQPSWEYCSLRKRVILIL